MSKKLKKIKKEKRKDWYFTFGQGQVHNGRYVAFFGTREEARKKMFDAFEDKWSMQYSEDQWHDPSNRSKTHNGFKPTDKVTMAKVWDWKEIH